MRQRRLHICVLLDVSESTSAIKSRVVCSLRLFLQERLARSEKTKRLDLYVFSDRCEKFLSDVELETLDFERFDEAFDSILACKGVTTLQDSLCVTIDALGAKLDALDEDLRPEEVVFVVITDGLDNSSQLYSLEDVKSRISLQSSAYHWNFVFFNAQLYQFCSDCPLNETPCDGLFNSQKKAEILSAFTRENEDTTEIENSNESAEKFDVEFSAVPEDVSEPVESIPEVEFFAVPEEIEEASESVESVEEIPEVEFSAVPEEIENVPQSVDPIPEVEFSAVPEEIENVPQSVDPIPEIEFSAVPEEIENVPQSVDPIPEVEFSAVPEEIENVPQSVESADPIPEVEFFAVPEEIEKSFEPVETAESIPEVEFFAPSEEIEESSESVESVESIPEVAFVAVPEEVEDASEPVESAEPIPEVEFFDVPEEAEETSEPVESVEPIPEVEFFAVPEEAEETPEPVESVELIPDVEFFAVPEEAEETSEPVESVEPIPEVEFFAVPENAEDASELEFSAPSKTESEPLTDSGTSLEQSATSDGENDVLTSDVAPPSDVLDETFDVVHFEDIDADTCEEQKSSSFDDDCEWEEYDVEDIKDPTIILPSSSYFTVKSLDPKLRVREDVVIDVESRDPVKDPPLSAADVRFEAESERKASENSSTVDDVVNEESKKSDLFGLFFSAFGSR